MNRLILCIGVLGLVAACGKPEPKTAAAETTSADVAAPQGHDELGRGAESGHKSDLGKDGPAAASDATEGDKGAKAAEPKATSGDPLADDGAGAAPSMEFTPKKQLRGKTRGMLDGAMKAAQKATTVDAAVKLIIARVGKPTWTEKGQRRVWIASEKTQCHRLVLETDGSLELETQPVTEWKMLSALTKQNACTGEIRRGIDSVK